MNIKFPGIPSLTILILALSGLVVMSVGSGQVLKTYSGAGVNQLDGSFTARPTHSSYESVTKLTGFTAVTMERRLYNYTINTIDPTVPIVTLK